MDREWTDEEENFMGCALQILPHANLDEIRLAWDANQLQDHEDADPQTLHQRRVEAAIDWLFQLDHRPFADPQTPPRQRPNDDDQPSPRPDQHDHDHEREHEHHGSPPPAPPPAAPAVERRDSPLPPYLLANQPQNDMPIPQPAKAYNHLLLSDDDDEEVQILSRDKGKGKARAVSPLRINGNGGANANANGKGKQRENEKNHYHNQVIVLDWSSDDEEEALKYRSEPRVNGRSSNSNNAHPSSIDLTGDSQDAGPAPRAHPRAQAAPAPAPVAGPAPPPPPPPPPAPVPPAADPLDVALASVLDIIPDVDPVHVRALLKHPLYGNVQLVLEHLFGDEYPKVAKKGAGGRVASGSHEKQEGGQDVKGKKRAREGEDDHEDQKNYFEVAGRKVLDPAYAEAALDQLCEDFPYVPKPEIRKRAAQHSRFYAPTYQAIQLALELPERTRAFRLLNAARNTPKGKGKEKVCFELETEKLWLKKRFEREKNDKKAAEKLRLEEETKQLLVQEQINNGEFFECPVCCEETLLTDLVECTRDKNEHRFCQRCVERQANEQIGIRKYLLPCMAEDGCEAFFSESEVSKFLPAPTLAALHKIKQEKEVDLAGLDGLTKCPFCPFACIIENEQERLLTCLNEACGIVSCRQCKKEDHLPKTCAEVDTDKKLNGLHQVEEAMTEALIRKCPKCSEPFVKESGCNKMTCPSCRTLSCYICSKIITGYEHFKNAGSNAKFVDPNATCALWDDSAAREHAAVEAARQAAAAELAKKNPAVVPQDIEALRLAPPPPPPGHVAPYVAPAQPAANPLPVQGRMAAPYARANAAAQAGAQAGAAAARIAAVLAAEQQNAARRQVLAEEGRMAQLRQQATRANAEAANAEAARRRAQLDNEMEARMAQIRQQAVRANAEAARRRAQIDNEREARRERLKGKR